MKCVYKFAMIISFIKMHGLGNDFAMFDGRPQKIALSLEKIRALADRQRGIGFDQAVVIDPPKTPGTEAYLRIFNADGGEVAACGNATRCIVKLLVEETGKAEISLETKAGKLAGKKAGDKVTVDMGTAHMDWKDIPLSHEENTLSLPIFEGVLKDPVGVSMGNPHAVFFVQDAETIDLATLGPKLEHHPLFPERANIGVASFAASDRLRLRVWERGAGLTQACGTGACAAGVAAVRRGLTGRRVTVVLDGGELLIEWRETDGHVLMTGDAVEVYRGEIDV